MFEMINHLIPVILSLPLFAAAGWIAFVMVRGFVRLFIHETSFEVEPVAQSDSIRHLNRLHAEQSRRRRRGTAALGTGLSASAFSTGPDRFDYTDTGACSRSSHSAPGLSALSEVEWVSGGHDAEGAIYRPETYFDDGQYSSGFDFDTDAGDSMDFDHGCDAFGDSGFDTWDH